MTIASSHPIQLYFFPTPNGLKISIVLEELEVPYDVHVVDIRKGDQLQPQFLAISPNNKIPAIVDPDGPDGQPISIFESGAILQYLGRKFGKLYPTQERSRVEVEQWLYWQVGGLGPMAGQANHFRIFAKEPVPYAIERYTSEVARLYKVMDQRLADREYLAGEFSIADIACVGWVKGWENQGQQLSAHPHLEAWLARMLARPGVSKGLKVGAASSSS